MVKVKIFGVLRSTTGFGYIEMEAKTVNGIFENISEKMRKGYYEDLKRLEDEKNDQKYHRPRNEALNPHKELLFKDAIVYVDGERCMRKKKKLSDGDEVWLLSPAAGG